MKKRLAVIGIRGFPGVQGGVEKHCEELLPIIAGEYDCRVYRRRPYLSTLSKDATYPGITFVDFPSTRLKGFEALFHTFMSCVHIASHKVDFVNVHNLGPGVWAPLLRIFGMKVVLTYHSPNYEHKKWGWLAKKYLKASEAIALRSANRVIFVNRFQMEKFPERVTKKSTFIPNGIERLERTSSTDFLARHGITPGEYVLGVGRITPEKGFDNLIKAANASPAIKQVVIAGAADHGSDYLNELKRLDTAGKTVFTGFTSGDDLRQLYSHARLFALTSLNEGFPLVMLEAMSYNLPMVVSDLPATRLIELPSSCYVPASDTEALSLTLSDAFINAPSEVAYQLEDYNWGKIADKTLEVYRLLNES